MKTKWLALIFVALITGAALLSFATWSGASQSIKDWIASLSEEPTPASTDRLLLITGVGSTLNSRALEVGALVDDTAFGASWDGVTTNTASKNAIYDYIVALAAGSVSDAIYGAGWNGDTLVAPSKNAVYDKINSVDTTVGALVNDTIYSAAWNGVTTMAPSKNVVYDQMEAREPLLVNSAGLAAAISNETGTGAVVFGTDPTITTGGLVTGDTSPDSAGEIAYDGELKFYNTALRTVVHDGTDLSGIYEAVDPTIMRSLAADTFPKLGGDLDTDENWIEPTTAYGIRVGDTTAGHYFALSAWNPDTSAWVNVVHIVNGDTGVLPQMQLQSGANLTGIGPISTKNGDTSGSYLDIYEDSDNGTDYVRIKADNDVGTNRKITFSTSVADSEDLSLTLGANDNTVTISSSTSATKIIGLEDYSLGAAGVLFDGNNDGAVTLLGLGNGFDENLTIDLDTTENTIGVSSSTGVTSINTGSIGLVTTGTILGAVRVDPQTGATYSLTAANAYGSFVVNNDNDVIEVDLPAVAAGMNCCVANGDGVSSIITVDPDDADYIILSGTKASAGEAVVSAGAAGEYICFIGLDSDDWMVLGKAGTWAEAAP